MAYMLGRLPATRPRGLRDLAVYAQGKLPEPPASVAPPAGVAWGIDGNDHIGDCTIAGVDHLIAAWNAGVPAADQDARPGEQQIEDLYFSLTGGQDTGLNEANVLGIWQQAGLFGSKISAYAPVQPTDIVGLHQAIAFYGGAYLGIACPESAQQQTEAEAPWDYVPGSQIMGGHAIVAVGYSGLYVQCVTWGKIVSVTYPFLSHYLEEAWAIISDEMVKAKGDALGIDLPSLLADLPTL